MDWGSEAMILHTMGTPCRKADGRFPIPAHIKTAIHSSFLRFSLCPLSLCGENLDSK